jgi:hypothetical protein
MDNVRNLMRFLLDEHPTLSPWQALWLAWYMPSSLKTSPSWVTPDVFDTLHDETGGACWHCDRSVEACDDDPYTGVTDHWGHDGHYTTERVCRGYSERAFDPPQHLEPNYPW